MRIIAGKHRGRRIEAGPDLSIRPTSDRVRESIFNILMHGDFADDSPLIDQQVLDIFCGTGAFGLEALSRGAAKAIFIDKDNAALSLTRGNAERMHETPNCKFLRTDAQHLPNAVSPSRLAFLDPPYRKELVGPTLKALQKGKWLTPDAIIVVETAEDELFELPDGYQLMNERAYGNTRVSILKTN